MKVRDRGYLRATLRDSGLPYREIARRAGVNHSTLANLAREGGRASCTAETADRIALALGKATDLLFLS